MFMEHLFSFSVLYTDRNKSQDNQRKAEIYIVGKATPVFGQWEWKGVISRQCKTLDGKTVTLAKPL